MDIGLKLLKLLSIPLHLRPSPAIRLTRLSRPFLNSAIASHPRLFSASPSSKLGFPIRSPEKFNSVAISENGGGEAANLHPKLKNSRSWWEWTNLTNHLLAKGYFNPPASSCELHDSMIMEENLPTEFFRAAEACLGFAREQPDSLSFLTKKYIKDIVENGYPNLFKNAEETVNRMRLFLSLDTSTSMESEKAQTVDIMRYLLSYMNKPFSPNGNQLKDEVEVAVRKLLLELHTFSGSQQKSKLTEPAMAELPLGKEQFSRPNARSFEIKRGDWICQKCTFINFARNVNCLQCAEARPKRQLTGEEWECPQCNAANYGRNTLCIRCDHKRSGDPPLTSVFDGGERCSGNSNLERNAPQSSVISDTGSSSDSVSRSLDRILCRLSENTPIARGDAASSARQSTARRRKYADDAPFIPFPPDMFRKPRESNSGAQRLSPNSSDLLDSLFKSSEKPSENEDLSNAAPDDDFPDIMPIRRGESRFVVSKKKDRSMATTSAYKRRLADEQANKYNSMPFVPFPPGYFAKKDDQLTGDLVENPVPDSFTEKYEGQTDARSC